MKMLTPSQFEKNIYGIELGALVNRGIKLLILDIDNTLVPRSVAKMPDEVRMWLLKAASYDLKIAFVSNGKEERTEEFCGGFYFYVPKALKPLQSGFKEAMKHFGVRRRQTCIIGDQLFTDILGANIAHIHSILVEPIDPKDEGIGVKLKRIIERPILKRMKPAEFALIGNPVFHSKSPYIHNKIYKKNNIKAEYKLYEPDEREIPDLLDYFRNAGYTGFNVTIPYKQTIMKHLTHIDDNAQQIGAVNTVLINNGGFYGYNTDGEGFAMQLEKNRTRIKGANIKIIGAGGATLPIVHTLVNKGAKSITIYNRTLEKAEAIAERYENVKAKPLSDFSADKCEILINTTSVGLDSYDCPVESLAGIERNAVVYDIIYSPAVTTFMQKALDMGLKAYNGEDMLLYQGLLADKIWLGQDLEI